MESRTARRRALAKTSLVSALRGRSLVLSADHYWWDTKILLISRTYIRAG